MDLTGGKRSYVLLYEDRLVSDVQFVIKSDFNMPQCFDEDLTDSRKHVTVVKELCTLCSSPKGGGGYS